MRDWRAKLRGAVLVIASVLLVGTAYLLLLSCDDPEPDPENCTNGRDDDGDRAVDCEDADCRFEPECRTTDGDGDADSEPDADDGDGGDGGDGDVAPDADDGGCDPEAGTCAEVCSRDEDCALALELMECCLGYPHRLGETVFVCPSAAHVGRIASDSCVIAWSSGDELPEPPAECAPHCEGAMCFECAEPETAVCDDGTCRALAPNGCLDDDDCGAGRSCIDPDGDGLKTCEAGAHECDTNEDCLTRYPTCAGCYCGDESGDGLRDCRCWGDPGCDGDRCVTDEDCTPHSFCEDHACEFAGDDACRVGLWDCDECFYCRDSVENPRRGTCTPIDPPPEGC